MSDMGIRGELKGVSGVGAGVGLGLGF